MTHRADSNRQLLVLDTDTPWITSLLDELPADWTPYRVGARSAGLAPGNWWRAYRDGVIGIPGWTRAFPLSTSLLARAVGRTLSQRGSPRAIIHTMPWTAGLLHKFPKERHVYRPQDYFGLYEWDQERVLALETELMRHCRVAIPMSPEHAGDLRQLGDIPIEVLPNGVSSEFVNRLRANDVLKPADLPSPPTFVVGCIGQINYYYNWCMIAELVNLLPDIQFVFIGPIIEEIAPHRSHIEDVLKYPNVRWLGWKPHRELPNYLYHFNLCLSPLLVTPANNRRSLLRLFDYLASEKPVLSTSVAAARSHGQQVLLGDSTEELARMIREVQSGQHQVDRAARRALVDQQTWAKRGQRLVEYIETHCASSHK